jgi:hypothetical protein
MARKVRGPPPDFSAFRPEVVIALLGREPPPASPWADNFRPPSIALVPSEWPRDDPPGFEYLHRVLARLLWERGGTVEAAASIRRDLVEGRLQAVIVHDQTGKEHPIPCEEWRAVKASAEMRWTGRSGNGFIYLRVGRPETVSPPEPAQVEGAADDWKLGPEQFVASWARSPTAQAEARRRLAAIGDTQPTKERISGVLTVMARECGRSLADDTIDRSLRRKPKTDRTPGP